MTRELKFRSEAEFDLAMLRVYQRILAETDYRASRFLNMLYQCRGVETAKTLLKADVSAVFMMLVQRNRLDLSVEAVIQNNPQWHPLFTEDELSTCRARLEHPPAPPARNSPGWALGEAKALLGEDAVVWVDEGEICVGVPANLYPKTQRWNWSRFITNGKVVWGSGATYEAALKSAGSLRSSKAREASAARLAKPLLTLV